MLSWQLNVFADTIRVKDASRCQIMLERSVAYIFRAYELDPLDIDTIVLCYMLIIVMSDSRSEKSNFFLCDFSFV